MSKTLLNECRACNMKFENSEQLQNHTKKFCQGSDYGDIQKLEEKIYNKELRDHRLAKGAISEENMQAVNDRKLRDFSKVGQMSLQDLRNKIKAEDREFERIRNRRDEDSDDELQKEIDKLNDERKKVKLQSKEDEKLMEDLYREMEEKKEQQIRNRIEKDQIRRALVDLEKAKLQTMGQEKKRELEEIEAERLQIKLRQQDVMKELEDLEQNQEVLNQMRQEEVDRMDNEVKKLEINRKQNNNVDAALVQEKAEKVTALKLRREQLEADKLRVEKNLGHIKNGDFHMLQKQGQQEGIMVGAKNMIRNREELEHYNLPGIREKLQENENKIRELRNQKQDPVYASDELLYKDGNRGLTDNVAAYYDDIKNKPQIEEQNLKGLRENLETMVAKHKQYENVINQASGQQQNNQDLRREYADNMVDDLNRLKNSYIRQGGKDPKFVQNVKDMESFYQNQQQQIQQNQSQQQLDLQNLPPRLDQQQYQQNGNTVDINTNDFQNPHLQKSYQIQQQQQPQQINIHVPPQNNNNQFQQQLQQPQFQPYQQQQQQQQQYQFSGNVPSFQQQQPQVTNNNINPQIQAALQQTDQIPQLPEQGFTLEQMMGGGGQKYKGDALQTFAGENEGFMQNEARNPDLNEEERALMNMQAQEVDALRVLSSIPVGTELYRFKMEQYKELSTIRSEMEKIVQEQRLQKLKKQYEKNRVDQDRKFEHQKWIDEQYKVQIQQKMGQVVPQQQQFQSQNFQSNNGIQSSNNNNVQQQQYRENQGFAVHFDYILGLPQRSNYAQIVFGVYQNGETIYSPKLTDPKDCELQDNRNSRCLINESQQMVDIPGNKNNLLIMEIQIPYSKNIEDNAGRTESFGWCVLNLFNAQREVNRGKWKCPVYLGPTDPQIQPQNIKDLKVIQNAWLYVRVSFINDGQYGQQRMLYPEQTMNEYNIAGINKGDFQGDLYQNNNRKKNMLQDESYEPSVYDNSRVRRNNQSRQSLSRNQDYSDILPQSAQSREGVNRGLGVTIEYINNYYAKSHLKVMVAILEGKEAMQDDNQLSCVFNSSMHNPKSAHVNPITNVIELIYQNPQMQYASNKQDGQRINFYEQYKFYKDLRKVYRQNNKEIFLGIQVVENQYKVNNNNQMDDDEDGYEQIDFKLIGWNFVSLTRYDGNLQVGKLQSVELYKPQMRTPPVNKSKVQKCEFTITLDLKLFEYDESQLMAVQNQRLNQTIPQE